MFSILSFFKPTQKIRFKPDKINIAIAIQPDHAQEVQNEMLTQLNNHIVSLEKDIPITLQTVSESLPSHEEAHEYIKKNKTHLIIWGNSRLAFENGQEVYEPLLHFIYNENLDYNTPDEFGVSKGTFNQYVEKAVYNRFSSILYPDILPHIRVEQEYVDCIATYILSRILMSFGYGQKSMILLSDLVQHMRSITNTASSPVMNTMKKYVEDAAVDCAHLLSLHYLTKEGSLELAEKYANKALEFNSNHYPTLINYSTISWIKGDKPQAKEYIKRAKDAHPSSNIVLFNEAFFSLDEGNYEEALREYQAIHRLPEEINLNYILNFLENEYKKQKKLAFLFGMGYLEFEYKDPKLGKKKLENFIHAVGSDQRYKPLIDKAKELISTK